MDSSKNYCQKCGRKLNPVQRPCPYCGGTGINHMTSSSVTVGVTASTKWRQRRTGKKRPIREGSSGWSASVDAVKHPNGVHKTTLIDRDKDEYEKKVVDKRTGEVVKDLKEPLSQHTSKPKTTRNKN
jgi:DnaJ-class molecular chaperone